MFSKEEVKLLEKLIKDELDIYKQLPDRIQKLDKNSNRIEILTNLLLKIKEEVCSKF